MAGPDKIATCCYCGARAALCLRGEVRHELACAQCGAPLRAIKALPGATWGVSKPGKQAAKAAKRAKPKRGKTTPRQAPEGPGWIAGAAAAPRRKATKKAGKKTRRRGLLGKAMHEVFDALDDIFD